MIADKLNELRSCLDEGRYVKALELTNELLLSPETEKYRLNLIQTKLVCLLAVEKFEEALRVLHENESQFVKSNAYNHAYCLYKLGQLTESWSLVQANKVEGDDKWAYLEAQIAYKLDDFAKSSRIYKQVLSKRSSSDEDYNELIVNYCASLACSGFAGSPIDSSEFASQVAQAVDTFDFKYNLACLKMSRGNIGEAQQLLEDALRILDGGIDSYSAEDIEAERKPIKLQLAIVKSISSNNQESLNALINELEHYVETCTSSDEYALHVTAVANLIRLAKPKARKFLSEKHHFHDLVIGKQFSGKLAGWHVSRLRCNHASVLAHLGKDRRARHHYDKAYLSCPTDDVASMFHLLFLARKGVSVEVMDEARLVLEKGQCSPALLEFILNLISLSAECSKFHDLIFTIVDKSCGFIETIEKSLSVAKISGCRDAVVEHVISNNPNHLLNVAKFLVGTKQVEKGIDILKTFLATDSQNAVALAVLLKAYWKLKQYDTAKEVVKQFPSDFSALSLDDVTQVIGIFASILPKGKFAIKKKLRKRVMRRSPKEESKHGKIDPERWLPKKQRSSYKRKHGHRNSNNAPTEQHQQQSHANQHHKKNKKKHGKKGRK